MIQTFTTDLPFYFQYESSYTRPRIEIKKPEEDKTTSRLGSKFGAYSSGYQRDSSASRDTGNLIYIHETPKIFLYLSKIDPITHFYFLKLGLAIFTLIDRRQR